MTIQILIIENKGDTRHSALSKLATLYVENVTLLAIIDKWHCVCFNNYKVFIKPCFVEIRATKEKSMAVLSFEETVRQRAFERFCNRRDSQGAGDAASDWIEAEKEIREKIAKSKSERRDCFDQ